MSVRFRNAGRLIWFAGWSALLIAHLFVAGGSAAAKDAEGVFAVRGVGQLPCRALAEVDDPQTPVIYQIAGWVDGYVTSLNRTSEATFDLMPWQGTDLLLNLLAQHCSQNPDQALSQAIQRMVTTMRVTGLATKSELETVETPEGPLQIYRDVLKMAQTRLSELGHYTSTVDGRFGPGTKTAFAAFQTEAGLQETGVPDQITLLQLFGSKYQAQ